MELGRIDAHVSEGRKSQNHSQRSTRRRSSRKGEPLTGRTPLPSWPPAPAPAALIAARGRKESKSSAPAAHEPPEYVALDALQHLPPGLAQRMMRSLQLSARRVERTESLVLELQQELKVLQSSRSSIADRASDRLRVQDEQGLTKVKADGDSSEHDTSTLPRGSCHAAPSSTLLGPVIVHALVSLTCGFCLAVIACVLAATAPWQSASSPMSDPASPCPPAPAAVPEAAAEALTSAAPAAATAAAMSVAQMPARAMVMASVELPTSPVLASSGRPVKQVHSGLLTLRRERRTCERSVKALQTKLHEMAQYPEQCHANPAYSPSKAPPKQPKQALPRASDALGVINSQQARMAALEAERTALLSSKEGCLACLGRRGLAAGCAEAMQSALDHEGALRPGTDGLAVGGHRAGGV